MMKCWWLRRLRRTLVKPTPFSGGHDGARALLARGAVEQSPDIMNEQRIEKVGDLLAIREI